MPKVVSRYTVSSSEQAKPSSTSRAVLRSYYCLCGDFTLVIQGKLDRLPRRKTDGSYIVRSRDSKDGKVPARKFKLNATPGDRYLLQRQDGKMEVRQPFLCGRCSVIVAYQMAPPPAGSGPFLYILRGALSETQGEVPDEAFEGEEQVFDPDDLANELFDDDDVVDDAPAEGARAEAAGAGVMAASEDISPQPAANAAKVAEA